MSSLPQLTGKRLRKILKKDGWEPLRPSPHGVVMVKEFPDGKRRTTIQKKRGVIPETTLGQILGPKQTGLGRDGLLELIDKHG